MMIQRSEVEYVAKLAKLELSEEEMQSFTKQLGSILDYMHNLEKIDTNHLEPAHILSQDNVFREDSVQKSSACELVLLNAPQREGRYFQTPQILPPREERG